MIEGRADDRPLRSRPARTRQQAPPEAGTGLYDAGLQHLGVGADLGEEPPLVQQVVNDGKGRSTRRASATRAAGGRLGQGPTRRQLALFSCGVTGGRDVELHVVAAARRPRVPRGDARRRRLQSGESQPHEAQPVQGGCRQLDAQVDAQPLGVDKTTRASTSARARTRRTRTRCRRSSRR